MLKIINLLRSSAIMNRLLNRIHDSVFALQTFNLFRFSAMFLVSILLVKIPLEVEQIADYEYALFLGSIVTGWWIHGFLQSFMADTGPKDNLSVHQVFKEYSRLFLWIGTGILLVVSLLIEILAYTGVLQEPPEGFYYYLFFHYVLQVCILIVYYFHRRKWTYGIYALAAYFLIAYIGSFALLLNETTTLITAFTCLAGFSVPVVVLWVVLYFRQRTGLPPKSSGYVPHLSILMLIQGIGFISFWSDGFWVQYFYGTEELFALFRYGGREFPLFVILTTTFSTAIIHQAGSTAGLDQIRRTSRRYIWLFLPLAIGLMMSSSSLFALVYHTNFVPASFIFDLYVMLVAVRVLFPRPILIAHRIFHSLLWISAGELLLNLVLSYTLYWHLGIFGLIVASLIAHGFELACTVYIAHRKLGISPRKYIPVRLYLVFVIILSSILVVKYGFFPQDWMHEMVRP